MPQARQNVNGSKNATQAMRLTFSKPLEVLPYPRNDVLSESSCSGSSFLIRKTADQASRLSMDVMMKEKDPINLEKLRHQRAYREAKTEEKSINGKISFRASLLVKWQ